MRQKVSMCRNELNMVQIESICSHQKKFFLGGWGVENNLHQKGRKSFLLAFSLFPTVFQEVSFSSLFAKGFFFKVVEIQCFVVLLHNCFQFCLPFPKQAFIFTCLSFMSFENTVGKRETAHNEQFLFYPRCCLLFWRTLCHFHHIQNCLLLSLSICSLGKG